MSSPLLCATVTAATTADLRRRRDEAGGADLIELRLDTVSDPDAAGALAGRTRPVIVTCRAPWEGGEFRGSEEERHRILAAALAAGAEYVDVEWRAEFAGGLVEADGRRVVLSSHDFECMPRDIVDRARAMAASGAAVVKIAAMANRLTDCLSLMNVRASIGSGRRLVLIAMGERGVASRLLAGRFGSAWTYAGAIGSVGQIGVARLLTEFRFRALSASTAVFGLVGSPVSHSVSPAMHNASFRASGIDAVYVPLPAADADDFVAFGRAFGVRGASVTIPYKVPLFDRVDEVRPAARRIGAINTIRVAEDGRWIGDNTDGAGFLAPLAARGIPLTGLRASILGAGGSARAVAAALAGAGAQVTVHARMPERARCAAAATSAAVGDWPPPAGSWDLLVNCTPIGMYPRVDESPVPRGALVGRLVYDLVYNPPVTRLLRDAAASGCETVGGLEMLVGQAEEQFAWWTGVRPAAGTMRKAAAARLAELATDENHIV